MSRPIEIQYIKGDATEPVGEGLKIIPHVVNDVRAWGAGFVLAVSKKWERPEAAFRSKIMKLKDVDLICVEPKQSLYVANMCAQTGISSRKGVPPIRYNALTACLRQVAMRGEKLITSTLREKTTPLSFHLPRIGCGLAGGKWELVEPIIVRELSRVTESISTSIYVYDF